MISSFEKYIKAAIDAKKYSVVCEMANIVHSDKNHINIMTYPGKDVRVYKNRDDEVQILCPKNISYVQESNLTKAISTGTIFDDADEVDKYAGFIVKTKMPIDAMTNKGLENPYKLREVVGSTIGVMNEDGEVDVSDADVDNGNNIIDDLLEKDSKEFKDVKNVVDDYLDNDDHSFGYDTDFTTDIQQPGDQLLLSWVIILMLRMKRMRMILLIRMKMTLKCLMMILKMKTMKTSPRKNTQYPPQHTK